MDSELLTSEYQKTKVQSEQSSQLLVFTISKVDETQHRSCFNLVVMQGEDCPICRYPYTNAIALSKCGHRFCKPCIDEAFTYHKKCPLCQMVYGITQGSQPGGTMAVQRSSQNLPGYEGWGCYIITYSIPSGRQDHRHPRPGQAFSGTTRSAYLPANAEGDVVLKMLRKAFDNNLIFTVGRSYTTGRDNVVTWNDIHHKTSINGGPQGFGFPDANYLTRVKEELAAKGIFPE